MKYDGYWLRGLIDLFFVSGILYFVINSFPIYFIVGSVIILGFVNIYLNMVLNKKMVLKILEDYFKEE